MSLIHINVKLRFHPFTSGFRFAYRILLNWTWIGQMMKCYRAIYFRRDKHHCSAGTHEQTTWGVLLSSLLEEETINSIDYAFNFQLEIRGPYLLAGQNISTQSSQTAAFQSEKSARKSPSVKLYTACKSFMRKVKNYKLHFWAQNLILTTPAEKTDHAGLAGLCWLASSAD